MNWIRPKRVALGMFVGLILSTTQLIPTSNAEHPTTTKKQELAAAKLQQIGAAVEWDKSRENVIRIQFNAEKNPANDDTFRLLSEFPELEELYAFFVDVSDKGIQHIKELARLRLVELVLIFKVTDKGVLELTRLPRLEQVSLLLPNMTNTGLRHLANAKKLKRLGIYGSKVNDEGLKHLAKMPQLERLQLCIPELKGDGLAHLEKLQSLTHLSLGSSGIGDNALRFLKPLMQLQYLNISETRITNDGLVHLTELKNLEHIVLDKTQVDDNGIEHLTSLKKLTRLDIRKTKITPLGIAKLKQALPHCDVRN